MKLRSITRLAAAAVAIGFAAILLVASERSHAEPGKDVRYVVVHSPGPAWKQGVPIFEQPGLQDHIDHYRKLQKEGRLALGGPFLDGDAGGMMIPEAGLTEEEVRAIAESDPAVKAGLLRVTVRPWLIGMKK